jgi:hypothetical protein
MIRVNIYRAEPVLAAFGRVTAVALVITLVVVFNAETLAWPIMLIRFKMSEGARKRMRETSSRWPLEWRNAVKVMTKLEVDSVLRDDEAPRWPGNKMVYLLYWVVYLLIELPAARIVLGSQSFISLWHLRKGTRSASNIVRLIGRIVLGLILIPVFLITWSLLALWTVVVGPLSAARRRMKQSLAKAQGEARAKAVWAAMEGRSGATSNSAGDRNKGPHDQNNAEAKKEAEQKDNEQEEAEEQVRKNEIQERRRLRKQTSLLVNPPEVLDLIYRSKEAEKSEKDESAEEPQEEEEEEEGADRKSSSEIAYTKMLENLRSPKAVDKTAGGKSHELGSLV